MKDGYLPSVHLDLDRCTNVHLVKQDELVAPAPISVHVLVPGHRPPQASEDECCEGEIPSGLCFVFPNESASPGYIYFHKAVDHVLRMRQLEDVRDHLPHQRIGDDGIPIVFLLHLTLSSWSWAARLTHSLGPTRPTAARVTLQANCSDLGPVHHPPSTAPLCRHMP